MTKEEKAESLHYKHALENYSKEVQLATTTSFNLSGRFVEARLGWATLIYTRLCTSSVTIIDILPKNKSSNHGNANWDFPAIASLGRNFIECYHTLFYLCIEKIPNDEWLARKGLFNLHDCVSRRKLFSLMGETNLINFDNQIKELQEILKANAFFMGLSQNQKNHFLSGEYPFLIDRYEIEKKIDPDISTYKWAYKFLSLQTHSLPMAFYGMIDSNRGRGIENDIEKYYIAMVIEWISDYLRKATKELIELFPDVVNTFNKELREILAQPLIRYEDSKIIN